MNNFYICASSPEQQSDNELTRALTVDPEEFCKNQAAQEAMPTLLAEAVNLAIAVSDAFTKYVSVEADYDIYPAADGLFAVDISDLRRADGAGEPLQLPPSYSMLLAAILKYANSETGFGEIINIPCIKEDLNKVNVCIPLIDFMNDADLVEVSYDGSGEADVLDVTRALYVIKKDTTSTRWSIDIICSYDIENEKFVTLDGFDRSVDEDTLNYAKSEDWYKKDKQ